MSWAPNDLCTDDDLVAYEATVLEQFGQIAWAAKRKKAMEDWLWPQLRVQKFPVERFRTRYAPSKVWGATSAVFTDYSNAARDDTTGDLPLASILAGATDYLYIGHTDPFYGLSIRVLDSVSSVSSTLSVSVWADSWETVTVRDQTQRVTGKPFSGGGAVIWDIPEGWVPRQVNNNGSGLYWMRLSVSSAPTAGTTAAQIGCIRRSLLCGPVACRTLMHIFREAPVAQDGPWREKADWYEQQADRMLERVIPVLGGEFDVIDVDDVLEEDEQAQTTAEVTKGGWSWERM